MLVVSDYLNNGPNVFQWLICFLHMLLNITKRDERLSYSDGHELSTRLHEQYMLMLGREVATPLHKVYEMFSSMKRISKNNGCGSCMTKKRRLKKLGTKLMNDNIQRQNICHDKKYSSCGNHLIRVIRCMFTFQD